jgi:hypothetical protein
MSIPAQSAAFRDGLARLAGLSFVVAGGTALGLHRDGDLISSDLDVDFIAPLSQQAEALRRFEGVKRRYTREWDHVLYQTGWWLGYAVDVHFYVPEGDTYVCRHVFDTATERGVQGRLVYPRAWLDAPEIRETKYGPVPLPGDVEAYLLHKYGPDWRTPRDVKGFFTLADGSRVQRVRR